MRATEIFHERAGTEAACGTGWDCSSGGLAGVRPVVTMVGFYYLGEDIRKSRTSAPLPTPAPLVEHAGDVEEGGLHILEIHLNTLLGGSGATVIVLVVVALTYCCMKCLLQQCCVNSCVLCCPAQGG